jgi:putative addiction module component (TIGR02574 family)
MPALQELGLAQLPVEERLAVAEALLDSVAEEVEAAAVPPAQLAELERRLADSRATGRGHAVGSHQGSRAREGAQMSLPVVLRDEAQTEFDSAFDFYDSRKAGLGAEFVAEVQDALDRIATNPLIPNPVDSFPFCSRGL